MRPNKESVLLKTSAATDVQCSGGEIAITGLKPVSKKNILDISQIKYKAEVAQVVKIAYSLYTPALDTVYAVKIGDVNRTQSGFEETLKNYSFRTPTTWGASLTTDALRREYIHGELITRINADASNKGVAASLLTGTGFTFTDDASYYPVYSQGMSNTKFVSTVYPVTNADGSGFAETDYVVTTAGVMKSGVGAYLAAQAPVLDYANGGNLVSGVIDTPPQAADKTFATSGQNYDCFSISAYATQAAWGGQNQIGYVSAWKEIWVDNGTGSATTNLTGFLAFERVTRKLIGALYAGDFNSLVEFFDYPTLFQGPAGAVPATTGESKVSTPYTQWIYTNIGTNTITVPTPSNTGLLLDQDLTDTEGAEHTPSLLTNNSQSFIVGKTAFSVVYKGTCADHTDAGFMVGFRKKAAHAADFNNYTDLGSVGFLGDLVYTWGILNNAATVATNTAVVPTDAAVEEFIVSVDATGAVTCKANGVTYPVYSVGTTALVFDAGDEMIPFVRSVNISGGDPDVIASQLLSTAAVWVK